MSVSYRVVCVCVYVYVCVCARVVGGSSGRVKGLELWG